ncbi:MAG TPA: histidine phosphatase family protein [Solirubrobacteraceae bacterium]|jgi:phosphohistidine phosphatase|nr:histidine phosphatase family protein [Solirubrobacteraceae bacterium]
MNGQLWLLRHGEAEPHGMRADEERRLTARGEQQSTLAGRALVALGVKFAAVLASPRVRALDTARLAAAAWGAEPTVHPPLASGSGFDVSDVIDVMAIAGAGARALIVGHEPDFSHTVRGLTGARIVMKKGGLAVVRLEGGAGELLTLLRPHELELIATAAT